MRTYYINDFNGSAESPVILRDSPQADLCEPPHMHDYIEIAIIRQGRGIHRIYSKGGQILENAIIKGDVFTILPEEIHSYDKRLMFRVYNLCIKSDFLAQFNEDLGQLEYFNAFFNKNRTFQINQLHLPPQTFCDVEKELQDLHVIIHSDRPCRLLAIRLSLLRFLLAVFDGGFKGWKQTGTSLNEQLFRSIADLEAHPTQHFSLVNMAEKAHMSISAYAHKFKELVGVSPGEYSLLLRLDLSKKILESTTLPCKEIAFHAGFNDCNYFIRAFKKRFGVTPKCYRSQRQIIL